MRLTLAQASRLWNADRALCALALQNLVEAGFLYRTDEFYARVDCGRRCA
jgi:predicted transcriptional regulator